MPNMIPNTYENSLPSPGERNFFERISKDIDAKDWVIFHSLNIAHHKTKVMGEIDFLVVIPNIGIFAIEIKAHSYITTKDGRWYMGRSDKTGTIRSPFTQVNQSMFSLKDYIRKHQSPLKDIPIFSLVIFTHTDFSQKSIEWHPTDYVSCREYRGKPISKLLIERFNRIKALRLEKSSTKWLSSNLERPNKLDIREITKLLRPSIESPCNSISISDDINAELIKFTTEQFSALDMMEENHRLIFNGAAGTGKTFVAIESAVRAAKKGDNVLFICMNNLLSEMLSTTIIHKNIKVVTLHAFMKIYDSEQSENTPEYWSTDLPQNCYLNMLEDFKDDDMYDLLVIDEAQDIIGNTLWLDCLDLALRNGLSNGRWQIFGDFNYQSIYDRNKSIDNLFENIKQRSPNVSTVTLKKNCRNIESSARLSMTLAGIRSPYQTYLRKNKPVIDSKMRVYSNEKQQLKILIETINKCINAGFSESEIVILSKNSEVKCIVSKYQEKLSSSIYAPDIKGLRFTSIHRFKGLEAPIIILTDFDEITSDSGKKLLFTGASRATDSVHYLFHKNIENTLTTKR